MRYPKPMPVFGQVADEDGNLMGVGVSRKRQTHLAVL
jgi:hypothetical protein